MSTNILSLMTRLFCKFKKIILINFLQFIIFLSLGNAEIYNDIKIKGNERLSIETILMFSGLNILNDITNDDLNFFNKKAI